MLNYMISDKALNYKDHFDNETAKAYHRRLGNMVLLQASKNSAIGNKDFSDRLPILKASTCLLTGDVATKTTWGIQKINERQKKLAQLAVKTWPLDIP
jgi:hypothetical protein